MRPDYDDPIPPILGLQIGVVVDRDDPEGLARVRVRIPGLVDRSNWAWPLGASGGGSEDEGFYNVPPLEAEVGIFFKNGHPDYPYYLPANWGTGEPPQASDGGNPDLKVLAMKEYDIVVDTRNTTKKFSIVDKAEGTNILEFDGATRSVKISATTRLELSSTGEVKIDGLLVTINGIPAGLGRL